MDGPIRERIAQAINKAGLSSDQVAFVLKKLNGIAYPRGSGFVSRLLIGPPEAKFYCSAFRETNIGGEKDLDSSVLWRVSQSLSSAVASLKSAHEEGFLEGLMFEIEMARAAKRDPVSAALDHFYVFVQMLALYHPIVVIDAPLWIADLGKLESIEWCRFEQLGAYGWPDWWLDIVHAPYFSQYADEITEYYLRQFKRAGAARYPYTLFP